MNWLKRFFQKDRITPEKIVQILERVKDITDLPLTAVVARFTPTPIDDMVLRLINNNIDSVIKHFKIVSELKSCNLFKSEDLRTACILQRISALRKETRGKHLLVLGARILSEQSNGKISLVEAEKLIQEAYEKMIKK